MSKWEVVWVYTASTVAQVCGAGQDGRGLLDGLREQEELVCGWWKDKVRGAGVVVLRDRSEESSAGRGKRKRATATHGSTDGRTTRVALFQ